jgi:hypothetical protein
MTNAIPGYKNTSPSTKQKIRAVVRKIHDDDAKKTAKQIRNILPKHPSLQGMPRPTERAIQDMIRKWDHPDSEKQEESRHELKQLGSPWHLGLTDDSPLSAQSIVRIFELKKWLRTMGYQDELTVLFVQWIDRLHLLFPDNEDLWVAVSLYSWEQDLASYQGRSFDSTEFDKLLSPGIGRSNDARVSPYRIVTTKLTLSNME